MACTSLCSCVPLIGNEGKPLGQAEAYDPAANKWSALPNMSMPLCSCSFTTLDGRLAVIGGLTVGGPSASLQLLSLNWLSLDGFHYLVYSCLLCCDQRLLGVASGPTVFAFWPNLLQILCVMRFKKLDIFCCNILHKLFTLGPFFADIFPQNYYEIYSFHWILKFSSCNMSTRIKKL